MTSLDKRRVAEWIGDAFAILCVRVSGHSQSEASLRLGFEAILRQLRNPPLRMLAKGAPAPYRRIPATPADLRHILKALDSSLAAFQRYGAHLAPAERELRKLIQDTRSFAEQELQSRQGNGVELVVAV